MTKFTITSEWGFIFAEALYKNKIDLTFSAKSDGRMTLEVKDRDVKKAFEVLEYTRVMNTKGV